MKIGNEISVYSSSETSTNSAKNVGADSEQMFNYSQNVPQENEISMFPEPQNPPVNHIKIKYNGDYEVKKGESFASIARKFNVTFDLLVSFNPNINPNNIDVKDVIKIPPTRTPININSLNDVALALNVSKDFLSKLKSLEDGEGYTDTKFHNTPYIDDAGVETIGIGHALKPGDKRNLSDKEVLVLFAKDLMEKEEQLWALLGKDNYNKMPKGLKEALLDIVFNKGIDIIKNDKNFTYRLKNGKYEAAINCFTNVKSKGGTGEEMSGLCKRRLFEISRACTKPIPNSNLATIQALYDKGITLLKKSPNYVNLLPGFNKDIKSYFGNDNDSPVIKFTEQ